MTAMAVAMTLGISAVSVAQTQQAPTAPKAERADHGEHGEHGEHGKMHRGRGPAGMLLRGIDLTAQQKEQLKALHQNNAPAASRADREKFGQVREQLKAARERGDSAEVRRIREQARAGMEQRHEQMKQQHEQMLKQVRAILTPAQQAQFDKNLAEMKQHHEKQRGERGKRPDGKKRDRIGA